MIKINDLAYMVIDISGKNLKINNISGPVGVRGRNSDNKLLREKLGWEPSQPLKTGIEITYNWIQNQLKSSSADLDIRDRFLS
jgi:nucleoside-diphosphate-sugar epimerase